MNLNFYLFCFWLYLFYQLEMYITEKVSYIVTERPEVVYFNKKFLRNMSVTSRRYSRDDPIYYINVFSDLLEPAGNNVSLDFYFFELQANRYHRTFMELHAKLCDFTETSTLFGDTLKKAVASLTCPFQPGPRIFSNLTIPMKAISKNFPYRQGRLFCNASITHNGVTSRLAEVTIDLEVKVASGNKFTNNKRS